MTLRYPLEAGGAASPDYVQFVPQEYRANNTTIAQQRPGGAAPGARGAQPVILYTYDTLHRLFH